MKIAIMQPYFFPYIGYFQLIMAVDKIILYDLVTYRKASWINRNRLYDKSKKEPVYFGVPIKRFFEGTLIRDIQIQNDPPWQTYLSRFLDFNYRRAPYYQEVKNLLNDLLFDNCSSLHEYNAKSIIAISNFLEIECEINWNNEKYEILEKELSQNINTDLEVKTKRIIEICKLEHAEHYINPIGGRQLYTQKDFTPFDIKVSFIETQNIEYKQFTRDHIPYLSILDVLFYNGKTGTRKLLSKYKLLT